MGEERRQAIRRLFRPVVAYVPVRAERSQQRHQKHRKHRMSAPVRLWRQRRKGERGVRLSRGTGMASGKLDAKGRHRSIEGTSSEASGDVRVKNAAIQLLQQGVALLQCGGTCVRHSGDQGITL